MAKEPFRRCDYCNTKHRSTHPWTLHQNTRKLSCSDCTPHGRLEDEQAAAIIHQHYDLLHLRLAAEPAEPYGDPLHRQYAGIKMKYPDAVLLFRDGDQYIAIADDALVLGRVLNLTLMPVFVGEATLSLARFPFHALDDYLPALVRAGRRVAICDRIDGDEFNVAAEPFGDPPLPRTHRLTFRASPEEVEVSLSDGRYYGLDGSWDIATTDRSIRRVQLCTTERTPVLYGNEHADLMAAEPMVRMIPKPKSVDGVQLVPGRLLDRTSKDGQVAVPVKAAEVYSFLGQRFYLVKDVGVELGEPSNWLVVHSSGLGLGLPPDRSRAKAIADSAALLEKAYEAFGETKLLEVLRNSTAARRHAAVPLPKFYAEPSLAAEPVEQYRRIKPLYKDALLILRDHQGYFMMYNDAKRACELIGLEYGGNGLFRIANSCLENVLDQLVRAGNRVAMVIDPAVDDPANARQTDLWDAIMATDQQAA